MMHFNPSNNNKKKHGGSTAGRRRASNANETAIIVYQPNTILQFLRNTGAFTANTSTRSSTSAAASASAASNTATNNTAASTFHCGPSRNAATSTSAANSSTGFLFGENNAASNIVPAINNNTNNNSFGGFHSSTPSNTPFAFGSNASVFSSIGNGTFASQSTVTGGFGFGTSTSSVTNNQNKRKEAGPPASLGKRQKLTNCASFSLGSSPGSSGSGARPTSPSRSKSKAKLPGKKPKFSKYDMVLYTKGNVVVCIMKVFVDQDYDNHLYDFIVDQDNTRRSKVDEKDLLGLSKGALIRAGGTNSTSHPLLTNHPLSLSIGDLFVVPAILKDTTCRLDSLIVKAGIQYVSFSILQDDGSFAALLNSEGMQVVFPTSLCRPDFPLYQPVWSDCQAEKKYLNDIKFIHGFHGFSWYSVSVRDEIMGRPVPLDNRAVGKVFASNFRVGETVGILFSFGGAHYSECQILESWFEAGQWQHKVDFGHNITNTVKENELFFRKGERIFAKCFDSIKQVEEVNFTDTNATYGFDGGQRLPLNQVVRSPKFQIGLGGSPTIVACAVPTGEVELFQVRAPSFNNEWNQWCYMLRHQNGLVTSSRVPEEALLDVIDPSKKQDASGKTFVTYYVPGMDVYSCAPMKQELVNLAFFP